jgi:hypothetical protein
MHLLGIGIGLMLGGSPQVAQAPIEVSTQDWVELVEPGPSREERDCANAQPPEWRLSLDGAKILAKPCGSSCFAEIDPWVATRGLPKRPTSARVDFRDGSLVGMDGGEFGGALWWIPSKGRARRLIEQNVRSIVPLDDQVVILTGLEHGNVSQGALYIGSRRGPFRRIVELQEGGQLAIGDEAGVLFLTSTALFRLTPAGDLTKLRDVDFHGLYPNSLVRTDGSLYIGMRHFVVRLTERDGRWHETWLAPKACARLAPSGDGCRCVPAQ